PHAQPLHPHSFPTRRSSDLCKRHTCHYRIPAVRLNAEELHSRIEPLFFENFSQFSELGAALTIWQNGEPMLDLHGGFRDRKREQDRKSTRLNSSHRTISYAV